MGLHLREASLPDDRRVLILYVAEPYTKRPGSYVSRADALRGCREILDGGVHNDLPAEAFYFTGTIDEIRRAAGAA